MNKPRLKMRLFQLQTGLIVLFIVGVCLLPMFVTRKAEASQIVVRKVTLSTAITSASSSYTFSFATPTTTQPIAGIKLIACNSALGSYPGGTCTVPSGLSFASGTYGSITGFTDSTAFTIDAAGSNDCIATAHPEVLCLKRTSAGNDTGGSGAAKTLLINAITNPNAAYVSGGNYSFFIGITTYSNNTWTVGGRVDSGSVAASVTTGLSVSTVVAEILQFCVGSTVDNPSGASDATNLGSCSGVTNNGVNLGTLDPTAVNKSPVATNGGNSSNGVAILRTNATNGSSVAYRAIQDTDGGSVHHGAFKIQGVSCSTTPSSCINSSAAQAAFTAGSQNFGMTIRGVNCTVASAFYACSYSGGTEHLVPQSGYIGQAATFGDTSGFKWREDGTTDTIALVSSNNAVADEALILEFGATPSISTSFGSYSVKSDFIATPTY